MLNLLSGVCDLFGNHGSVVIHFSCQSDQPVQKLADESSSCLFGSQKGFDGGLEFIWVLERKEADKLTRKSGDSNQSRKCARHRVVAA